MEQSYYERFIRLYTGLNRAYGKYIVQDDLIATDGEKVKGEGRTLREELTADQYIDHLDGEDMLGVVPIMDGNLCWFGAIDIDDYNLDVARVLNLIREMQLPLVATRSKSGGLHLWFFFEIAVPARAIMQKLEEIADALGFPGVEIFPKQHQIGPSDVGNWINLPWFDAEKTERYGWDDEGEEIRDLGVWLDYAESKRITLRDLIRIRVREHHAAGGDRPFADGPPCLQTLAERGIGEGMRNNVMFSIGVYAHNKFDENVDQISFMFDANKNYFDPPLADNEIEQIRGQVDDNEYRYPCQQAPIKDVCNRPMCLRRRFGVRLNNETYSFGSLWQFVPITIEGEELPDEATWRLQVNHNDNQYMLDLSLDELLQPRSVQNKAIQRRFVLPNHDNQEWRGIMEDKITHCEVVHVPEELSSIGRLRHHISQFLHMYSHSTESKVEITHGKVWFNEEEDLFWFKSEPFLDYLRQQRYDDYKGTKLYAVLRDRFLFKTDSRHRLRQEDASAQRVWKCPSRLRIQKDMDTTPKFKQDIF